MNGVRYMRRERTDRHRRICAEAVTVIGADILAARAPWQAQHEIRSMGSWTPSPAGAIPVDWLDVLSEWINNAEQALAAMPYVGYILGLRRRNAR